MPAAQAVHEDWPVREVAVPGGHGVHTASADEFAPGGPNVPAGQGEPFAQLVTPVKDDQLPAGHGIGVACAAEVAPAGAYVPAGDAVPLQGSPAVLQNPGVHLTQV